MATFTVKKKRWVIALAGGFVCHLLLRAYVFFNDRELYEDTNLLITVVSILMAASVIYLILWLVGVMQSSRR